MLNEFSRRQPGVRLELQEFPLADPTAGLATGHSDVALIRLPVSLASLETETLFVEPRVAAVPTSHPLAGRRSLRVAELLDEPLTIGHSVDPAWRDFWSLAAHRNGAAPPPLIPTNSPTEELHLVAAGMAATVTVAALARVTGASAGVRFLPIDDIPGSTFVVAWRPGCAVPELVEHFVATARAVRDREQDIVHDIEHPQLSG